MAKLVREIQSPELFSLSPGDSLDNALAYLMALGISSAPVVDETGHLRGIISLRDLLQRERDGVTVAQQMSTPAVSVGQDATIEDAGELIGRTGHHHLPVVDERGVPVGMVSSLDVIRGLLGQPAAHPATSPHYDPDTGVAWTDDHIFSQESLEDVPEAPGVFALIRGGSGAEESMVWIETANNVRSRLRDIIVHPERQTLRLQRVLAFRELRFRTAEVLDTSRRERLATTLLGKLRDE